MLSKGCLNCGKSFDKPVNESMKNWSARHKYCSRGCSDKAKIIEKTCSFCKEAYTGRNKLYCSSSCRSKVNGFKKGHVPHPKTVENLKNGVRFKKGQTPWNKGIVWEEMRAEKHPNWKGGYARPRDKRWPTYTEYRAYRDWQKAVFARDNWECQFCGKHGGVLHADHIKPWISFPELRNEVDNGRTLCPPCHRKTDTYGRKPKAA